MAWASISPRPPWPPATRSWPPAGTPTPWPTAAQQEWWKTQSGQQSGDPAKLAQALVTIASEEQPPRRFIAGVDAIATAEKKVADLQAQIDAYRDLSTALAHDT